MSLLQAQPLMFVRPWGQLEWNPGLWVIGVTPFRYVCESRTLTLHFSPPFDQLGLPFHCFITVLSLMSISLCPAPSLIVPLLTVLFLLASSFTVLSHPALFCFIPFPPLLSSPLSSRDLLFSYLIFADSNLRYAQLLLLLLFFWTLGDGAVLLQLSADILLF